jgi:uncharacterized membrane protein YdjX (TVP38/TMEM64 family)
MSKFRVLLGLVVILIVLGVYWFDLYQYLTLEFYREQHEALNKLVNDNLVLSVGVFFAVYVSATAISLPVAGVMVLVAGALFGVVLGSIVISVSSTVGATLAFLLSRFLFQDFVDRHFPKATEAINAGIVRDGPYYLFSIRLVPLFPYFVINLAMGLTHIRVWTFAWVTQLGLLPITVILANAGEQVALIKSPGDIMSPTLVGSLTLVGLFPLISKKLLGLFQAAKPS